VAWLRIPGTKIDYPVMHGADNRWYLSHDFLGREATAGAVFLDYRNKKDFSDMVMIIYGHRMNGDLMFSDVAKYSDDNYFSEHSGGELYLRSGEKRCLRAVVFSQIDSDDELYDDLALPDFDEPVVVLSTCDRYEHEKRDVLIMKIEEW
jgi:sortase B